MKLKRAFVSLVLCTVLQPARFVKAEVLEEKLPYYPEVSTFVVSVFEGEKTTLFSPEASTAAEGITLKVPAGEFDLKSLATGIIVLKDGRVVSTPVHSIGHGSELSNSSSRLLNEKAGLAAKVEQGRDKLSKIDLEISATNKKLREDAGMAEVDTVYERIAALDEKIKAAKGDTETMDGWTVH